MITLLPFNEAIPIVFEFVKCVVFIALSNTVRDSLKIYISAFCERLNKLKAKPMFKALGTFIRNVQTLPADVVVIFPSPVVMLTEILSP